MDILIALGPLITTKNMTNRCLRFLSYIRADVATTVMFNVLGLRHDVFSYPAPTTRTLLGLLCTIFPNFMGILVQLICGPDRGSINPSTTPLMAEHEPGGTSLMNICKWAQSTRSGDFAYFDYGAEGNMARYGRKSAPLYDTSCWPCDLPIALFRGGEDTLADPVDVNLLTAALKKANVRTMITLDFPNYNHLDFLWHKNAYLELYPDILCLLALHKSSFSSTSAH